MRGIAPLLALLLAGCLGAAAPDARETEPPPDQLSPMPDCTSCAPGNAAPRLALGTAWTYEGTEFYNEDTSFTVVVAEVGLNGYHFAAGAEDDLVYQALWRSPWYGQRDLSLNAEGEKRVVLPLAEGARWTMFDGLEVTAQASEVETPLGRDPGGFVITGATDRIAVRMEYSPLAGNLVLYEETRPDGSTRDSLRMTRIAHDQPWVWYELGPLAAASNPHEPAVFEVGEGFDAILVSAGGTAGGRARVDGAGTTWDTEFTGAEAWQHAILPGAPGRYVGTVTGRPFVDGPAELPWPVGWAYMHVAPVTWVRGSAS